MRGISVRPGYIRLLSYHQPDIKLRIFLPERLPNQTATLTLLLTLTLTLFGGGPIW